MADNVTPLRPDDPIDSIQFAEDTLAIQFADLHYQHMRYVDDWKGWRLWNGAIWIKDDTLAVFDKVRDICRMEAATARRMAERAGANKPQAAGKRLLDAKVIAAVEKLARSDRRLAATSEQWDADVWRLNTPTGSVDLRTASWRDPEPLDYATKCTAVTPNVGPMPLFVGFLDRITNGDVDLQSYLQRFAGYCLTGVTIEHAFFFFYGTGANGKTVLTNTFTGVMGDYAMSASSELFVAKKDNEHPTGIAGLRGARLVAISETEKGARWAEARLKNLTGGDKVSARLMRQDYFEFTPQFKLVIAGNHKPSIRGVDEAMRRRMNLVPFTQTIPPEERDPELFERLKAEWPAILAWMIEGCLLWQRDRLAVPMAVNNATEAYMETEDAFSQWLLERCDQGKNFYCLSSELFENWKQWAEKNGEYIGSAKALANNLQDHGFNPKRQGGTGQRGFQGIKILVSELL